MSINSLDAVYDFFEEVGDDVATGLTKKKIYDRATLIDDPKTKNKVVFEVERHRGVLGAFYTPGLPLSSFVTYWPIYIFDPINKLISEKKAVKKPVIEIDTYAFIEEQIGDMIFSLEQINDSEYLFEEATINLKTVIQNEQDIIRAVVDEYGDADFSFYKSSLTEFYDDEKIEEILDELNKAYIEAIVEKAQKAWEDQK